MCLAVNNRTSEEEEEEEKDDLKRAAELAERAKSEPQATPTQSESSAPSPSDGRDLRVKRSRSWVGETDRRLAVLAGRMVGVLVTGDGWRGRRGVVLWAHCLLGNCHRLLVAMTPILLEALLSLTHDSYSQVSSVATTSLVSLSLSLSVSWCEVLSLSQYRTCSQINMPQKVRIIIHSLPPSPSLPPPPSLPLSWG